MKYFITLATCFVLSDSCISQIKFSSWIYAGNYTSVQLVYIFNSDKTFYLDISGGHFSGEARGDYFVKSDTVFIISWPKEKQRDGKNPAMAKDTFLIEADSCLVSLTDRYDYCKVQKWEDYGRQSREKKTIDVKKAD